MFSDIEGFGLLYLMKVVDADRRHLHARSVVDDLQLDPRLEDLIPPQPFRGKPLQAYERVLDLMRSISALDEPERTDAIAELAEAVAESRKDRVSNKRIDTDKPAV